MLILTRRPSEKIIIESGCDIITVEVLTTKGNQVRIGIDAPQNILINRKEIHDRKEKQCLNY